MFACRTVQPGRLLNLRNTSRSPDGRPVLGGCGCTRGPPTRRCAASNSRWYATAGGLCCRRCTALAAACARRLPQITSHYTSLQEDALGHHDTRHNKTHDAENERAATGAETGPDRLWQSRANLCIDVQGAQLLQDDGVRQRRQSV